VVLVEMQAHQETSLLELALLVVKVVQEVLVVLHTLADSQVITLASLLIRS
jgi:predicted transcriptional regulator